MKNKQKLTRLTIDISDEEHKNFKALAAMQGKSMREMLIEAIQKYTKQKTIMKPRG